jgi:2-methylcitrate dehydratase PrpD
LAQRGFTANENILEGKFGFSEIFSGGKVQGLDHIESLGDPLQIISPGISFKAYPCCRSTHSSIDATLYLRDAMGVEADRVAKIICKTSPRHTELARFHKPKTAYEGKFSIPYCIAAALLRGRVLLEDFTNEKVMNPQVQALLALVDFEYPPELSQGPVSLSQEIVIRLQEGKAYSHTVNVPKGDPANPMTEKEMADKFRDCAGSWLPKNHVEDLLKLLLEVDSLEHCSDLFEILTQSAKVVGGSSD